MANHSDKLAVAMDLHPDDTKAVLCFLIGDALDHPGEHLPIRQVRLPCAAADAFLHLCAVGAFETDLRSSIGAMQFSSVRKPAGVGTLSPGGEPQRSARRPQGGHL